MIITTLFMKVTKQCRLPQRREWVIHVALCIINSLFISFCCLQSNPTFFWIKYWVECCESGHRNALLRLKLFELDSELLCCGSIRRGMFVNPMNHSPAHYGQKIHFTDLKDAIQMTEKKQLLYNRQFSSLSKVTKLSLTLYLDTLRSTSQ